MQRFAWLFPVTLLLACEHTTEISLEGLDPIPGVDQLDYSTVRPSENTSYWELRSGHRTCQACNDPADIIVGSSGSVTRAQLAPAIRAALDALRPATGFAQGCLPSQCFQYIAAVQDGNVVFYNTIDGLKTFLGPVNSVAEAVLLLTAAGYWGDGGSETGMKAVGSGWEFVALQTVQFCAPYQIDRVRLRIGTDAVLRILIRELYDVSNACA